ncbi:Protein of unknown function UPF0178 [Rhabdaerophilaceae bacterium]
MGFVNRRFAPIVFQGEISRVSVGRPARYEPQGAMISITPLPREPAAQSILILVDADACPVKDEIYKIAFRHGVQTIVVANGWLNVPKDRLVERVVVAAGLDVADDWIAAKARPGAIIITADVPLAARGLKAGAVVLAPNGKAFTEHSIGAVLATRDLMDALRSAGEQTAGPPPFRPQDRSQFLAAMDLAVVRLKRAGFVIG